MDKRLLCVAVGTALISGNALAAPFNSVDPRSMAMGGAGVASSSPATAPFFNPAGLGIAKQEDDFATELPIVGMRVYDPKDLYTGIGDFQDADVIGQISRTGLTDAQYRSLAQELLTDPNTGLPAVSGKPVQVEAGVATVISIPSKSYGMAFFMNGWGAFGGRADLSQHDLNLLNQMITDCDGSNPVACANDANNFTSDSQMIIRGLTLSEVGITLSRQFLIRGMATPVAIGVTPKYVKATTYDYSATVNTANTADVRNSEFSNEQTNFNLDFGLAQDYRNGWRSGFVVKNVVPQEYKYKQFGVESGKVDLGPQARAGVSYQNNWFMTALDVDLTENDPAGLEEKSRYVALGVELNALDWAQLRLGYRANTVNSERNTGSMGVGLSPLGLHFDLAVAGNANELGVAAQLGFRF
jgi:hypothetical protein